MARTLEALHAGLVELAKQRRRGRDDLAIAPLVLRRQPAGLVGLVPDRPLRDARQRAADAVLVARRARVAPADRLDEVPEACRDRLVRARVAALAPWRLAVRVGRARPGDREVDAHAELRGVLDEVVVAVPVARRVRARVLGLEAPALGTGAIFGLVALEAADLLVRQRGALADRLPQHRRADDVDAEGAHLDERAPADLVGAIEQLIVVHHHGDLIRRCLCGGHGQCQEQQRGERKSSDPHRRATVEVRAAWRLTGHVVLAALPHRILPWWLPAP